MSMTMGQATTQMDNAFGKMIDDFEKDFHVFETVANGISGIAKSIDGMNKATEGEGLKNFLMMLIPVVGFFPAMTKLVTGAAAMQADAARADPETIRRRAQGVGLSGSAIPGVVNVPAGNTGEAARIQRMENIIAILEAQGRAVPQEFQAIKTARDERKWSQGLGDGDLDFTVGDEVLPEIQELETAFESLGGMGRNLAIETDLLNKQWEAAANTEMEKLKLAQRQESIAYANRDATEQQLEQLDSLHEAEQLKLQDTLDATKATEDAAEATATMAEGIEVANELGMALGEIFGGSKGAQMVQNAFGLADAIAKQNPLGVFANTLGLVTTALSGTSDELNEFAESSDRLGRQLSAANKATQSATKGYLGEVEFDRQMEVLLSPIKHAFDTFAGESRLTGSGDLDTLANFFQTMSTQSLGGNDTGIMGDIRSFIEEMDNAGNTSGKENIYSYMLKLQALLGDDATLLDAAQNMFRLEESIRETGDAAGKAAADMSRERSVRMEFDVEEMAMRKRAQGRMQMAGADPYLQNRVLKGLSRSIDNLRSRESASLRAARTGSPATVTVGSGGGGGSGGSSGSTSPTTGVDSSGALVPEVRLNEIVLDDWADAVDVSNATPIDKNWNEIVPLIGGGTGHKRIDPLKWFNVVELKTMDTKMGRINKTWNEIIPLIGSGTGHKRIDPEFWYNVVELKTMDTRVGRIQKTWNEIIPLIGAIPGAAEKRINPGHWDVVIEVSDLNKNPIGRNWDQVVSMGDKIGVNGWSDIFRFGQEVQGGGTAPMPKMALGWGDVFNLDNLGTIELDVGAAVRLVGERKKVNIGDLIDMGALDGIITKSVNRAIRDRSVTVKHGASNSTSGTSTPSNSQKSNFRGPTATPVRSGTNFGGN